MRTLFNYKTLAIAIASVGAVGTAQAAGLDRSGQDVTAFLQDGTYAEVVYTYLDADVSGNDNGVAAGAGLESAYVKGAATGDMAETYDFFRYGVKTDINDTFSVGVLYDEPFGAAVEYSGDNNFVSQGGVATYAKLVGSATASLVPLTTAAQIRTNPVVAAQVVQGIMLNRGVDQATATTMATQLATAADLSGIAEATAGEGTNVEIRTHNITALLGAKLGANKNFQVYGGAAAQHLTGEVHLRGTAYQAATGYDAKISPDQAYGWVAGVAYSKPEIALRAALTYRSEIEHETTIAEVFPALALTGRTAQTTRDFKVTLPESYTLDFQTGVNPTTLLTAKVRYVPWGDFSIDPPTYGDAIASANNGVPLPIASYAKDQWSAELGLGKKLSDKISVSGSIGWDSGAGNPVTTLGPIDGYYSVGLGAKYNITPEWSISAGGKYLMFGDATANLPTGLTAGKFEDNDGYALGVKIAYHAK